MLCVRVEKYRQLHDFLLYVVLRFGLDYGLLHSPQPNKDHPAIGGGNPCEHIHTTTEYIQTTSS